VHGTPPHTPTQMGGRHSHQSTSTPMTDREYDANLLTLVARLALKCPILDMAAAATLWLEAEPPSVGARRTRCRSSPRRGTGLIVDAHVVSPSEGEP
jgi:hypothetical protein